MAITMWLIALVALAALAAMAAWARHDERLPEMATIPSPRHGEKVTVCGYEWTIM